MSEQFARARGQARLKYMDEQLRCDLEYAKAQGVGHVVLSLARVESYRTVIAELIELMGRTESGVDAQEQQHEHAIAQAWVPEVGENYVYLVAAEDRTRILKMCRPDHGSDLLMAGYIMGLQLKAVTKEGL